MHFLCFQPFFELNALEANSVRVPTLVDNQDFAVIRRRIKVQDIAKQILYFFLLTTVDSFVSNRKGYQFFILQTLFESITINQAIFQTVFQVSRKIKKITCGVSGSETSQVTAPVAPIAKRPIDQEFEFQNPLTCCLNWVRQGRHQRFLQKPICEQARLPEDPKLQMK